MPARRLLQPRHQLLQIEVDDSGAAASLAERLETAIRLRVTKPQDRARPPIRAWADGDRILIGAAFAAWGRARIARYEHDLQELLAESNLTATPVRRQTDAQMERIPLARLVVGLRTEDSAVFNSEPLASWLERWLDGPPVRLNVVPTDDPLRSALHNSLPSCAATFTSTRLAGGNRGAEMYPSERALILYERGEATYEPEWEKRARDLAATARSAPFRYSFAFATTTAQTYPSTTGRLDLDIQHHASSFRLTDTGPEGPNQWMLWQDTPFHPDRWIGTAHDWWTPEGTRTMRAKQTQRPLDHAQSLRSTSTDRRPPNATNPTPRADPR